MNKIECVFFVKDKLKCEQQTCPEWIKPITAHDVWTKFDRFPSSGIYSYFTTKPSKKNI